MSVVVTIMDRNGFDANTDIIVIVDGATQQLTWIPRDVWSPQTVGDRINTAYQRGGATLLLAALAELGWQVDASLCLSRAASEALLATARVLMPIPTRMSFAYPLTPTEPIENGAKQIEFTPPAEILVGERLHQWIGARGDSDLHRIERQKLLLRRLLDQKFDFSKILAHPAWLQATDPTLFAELAQVRSTWAFTTASGFVDQFINGMSVLVAQAHYPIRHAQPPLSTEARRQRLHNIITTLHVEQNPHYQPHRTTGTFPGGTYCNVFAADVVHNYALTTGTVYHFTEEKQPAHKLPKLRYSGLLMDGYCFPPVTPDGKWLGAGRQLEWLGGNFAMTGPSAADRGWAQVTAAEATRATRQGLPVLVGIAEEDKHHMAILHPTAHDNTPTGELSVAQAGRVNATMMPLEEAFQSTDVTFFRLNPPEYSALQRTVLTYIASNQTLFSGVNVGYAFVDVRTGQLIAVNGYMPQPALTLFQPVLAACYWWMVENEYIHGDEEEGAQLLAKMLSPNGQSDTASEEATLYLLHAIGGLATFNDWMVDQGFSTTANHLARWPLQNPQLHDTRAAPAPLNLRHRASSERNFAANLLMPAEVAHFMARVARGEMLNATHTAQWLDLTRQPTSAHGRRGASDGEAHYIHETRIVETPQGTFVLCLFAKHRVPFTAHTIVHNLAALTSRCFEEAQLAHAQPLA